VKKSDYINFIEFPISNTKDSFLKRLLVSVKFNSIHFQEHDSDYGAGSLVPIYKGMIFDDMEKISRGHLEKIIVQILTPETGGGYGQSRL